MNLIQKSPPAFPVRQHSEFFHAQLRLMRFWRFLIAEAVTSFAAPIKRRRKIAWHKAKPRRRCDGERERNAREIGGRLRRDQPYYFDVVRAQQVERPLAVEFFAFRQKIVRDGKGAPASLGQHREDFRQARQEPSLVE